MMGHAWLKHREALLAVVIIFDDRRHRQPGAVVRFTGQSGGDV